ncbi:hypothetical protein [Hymenobacter defluvii]|uniref:Uncharacterized protein n=1 Tax=Hymenobacter defluvii TaxID=2054411 RepID=A0ABS3THU7_9BACT|nr:hypothetical protein [Hymenobacter defluvii]MBO3273213.1 hypothetical protein [Hymenobacter defluvii]
MAKLHASHLLPACATAWSPSSGEKSDATAYILERRVQKQYRALLFDGLADLFDRPATDALDYLLETAFPAYFQRPQRDRCQILWQAEERVQYDIPEIISRLPQAELERLKALLDAGDLLGVVHYVWYELRPQLRRLDPTPRTQQTRAPHPTASLSTPTPPREQPAGAATLATLPAAPAPLPATIPCATCAAASLQAAPPPVVTPARLPTLSLHHLRVKRAQERKRLHRKRR